MVSEPTTDDPKIQSTATSSEPETAVETARRQLQHAVTHLEIDSNSVERLRHPTKIQEVTVPVERDDGTVEVFTGIEHSTIAFAVPTREDSAFIRR